jgi:ankyrin repeat protein
VQKGNTALICAGLNGHVECARLLLEVGADKEAKNNVRESVFPVCVCLCLFLFWLNDSGIL